MLLNRPNFTICWLHANEIYKAGDSATHVAKTIGGLVRDNIKNVNPNNRWTNTCAIRMSYILNQSGVIIPKIMGQTSSGIIVFNVSSWNDATGHFSLYHNKICYDHCYFEKSDKTLIWQLP